jgi:DNA-binding XRE family transcriptional regulator
MKTYIAPARPPIAKLPSGLLRRKPRSYPEWRALRSWRKLPAWEPEPVGYLLRLAREGAGLTQLALAKRLGVTQQSVAQAERWGSNPTVEYLRDWAAATESVVRLSFRRRGTRSGRR